MSQFSNIAEDIILKAIETNTTLRGILRELNLSSGEYNRKQLKQFMINHNIEFTSTYNMNTPLSNITKEELESLVKESMTFGEVLEKLGYGTSRNGAYHTLRNKITQWNIDISHMTHYRKGNNERATDETVFSENSPHHRNTIRNYVKRHNKVPYECAICGNKGEWNGKPLTLTLDHINGNHDDNRLENLGFICPNCDSQSETYGSKNKMRYYR